MKHELVTPVGTVWLWGELTGKPVMLLITGAFADEDLLDMLPEHLPQMDVLRAHLPGNHCPELVGHSIGLYAAAYDAALRVLAPDVSVTVFGLSTGALVALALRHPTIRQLLLVEPPLRTGKLWPLAERFASVEPGWAATFVQHVFGMGQEPVEDRDYTGLLDRLKTPTLVVMGGVPLNPRRDLDILPSLVDEPERDRLRHHPWVRTVVAPDAGHNVPAQAQHTMFATLAAALPDGIAPLTAGEVEARRRR